MSFDARSTLVLLSLLGAVACGGGGESTTGTGGSAGSGGFVPEEVTCDGA